MKHLRISAFAALAFLATGCGGGGVGVMTFGPSPSASPTITPTATPSPTAGTATPTAIASGSPTPHASASAQATPTPTASPTQSPGPNTLTLVPNSLELTVPGQTAQVTASQESYTGAYTIIGEECGETVATISPQSTTSGVFTITEQGAGGPCQFTLQGSTGVSATITVTASVTSGMINLRSR